jgi:hypothetical protein
MKEQAATGAKQTRLLFFSTNYTPQHNPSSSSCANLV